MEVILLERVRTLGNLGDIITVKDGYGRNFLLPKGKALRATKANKDIFAQRRAVMEKENYEKKVAAERDLIKLGAANLIIVKQAGEDKQLYGSVTAREIASLLAAKYGVAIGHENVQLGSKLKEIGVYDVTIALHPEVQMQVKVSIARSEQEALDNINKANLEALGDAANEKSAAAEKPTE